jgi:hypothetical protein
VLYGISDQRPSATVKRTNTIWISGTNSNGTPTMFAHSDEVLGKPNQYENIFCRLSFIDIQKNTSILSTDLWTDADNCSDEVVECMITKILTTIGEVKGKKSVTCLK